MNIKQAVVFAILMENGGGISDKSENYVAEKLQACEGMANPEQLLDSPNMAKFQAWFEFWSKMS